MQFVNPQVIVDDRLRLVGALYVPPEADGKAIHTLVIEARIECFREYGSCRAVFAHPELIRRLLIGKEGDFYDPLYYHDIHTIPVKYDDTLLQNVVHAVPKLGLQETHG